MIHLFINPILAVGFPAENFSILKPQSNFTFGILDRIASMANVSANLNAKVSSDGSRGRFQRIRRAEHLSTRRDSFFALHAQMIRDGHQMWCHHRYPQLAQLTSQTIQTTGPDSM